MEAEAGTLAVWKAEPAAAAEVTSALAAVRCPYVGAVQFDVWTAVVASLAAVSDFSSALARAGVAGSTDPPMSFIVQLPAGASATMDALSAAAGRLVAHLRGGEDAAPVMRPEQWWFRSAGCNWFVTVHAALYPPTHSRHWPLPSPIVALVPEWAFRTLFPDGPSAQVRQAVRAAFVAAGQRYPRQGGALSTLETA